MNLSDDPVFTGVFLERPNRFIARIQFSDGQIVEAHVPNTGRMRELLVSGAVVKCAFHPSPKRKTAYTLLAVLFNGVWVCVYAAMANALAETFVKKCPGVTQVKREVKWGSSRFDLGFVYHGRFALYEVKSVNLVTGRTAMFPDAPTVRGSKHLTELIAAQKQGYHVGVLFIVMREDADCMMPNAVTDPVFAENLYQCIDKDADVKALRCIIRDDEIKIDTEIPVLKAISDT